MATSTNNVTLKEAIHMSHSKNWNTFFWRTKENIFGDADFSKEYTFNSICVVWGRYTYAYTCYLAVDKVPCKTTSDTFMIGTNKNNGYFSNLEELRRAYPKLFEVKGEYTGLLVTL